MSVVPRIQGSQKSTPDDEGRPDILTHHPEGDGEVKGFYGFWSVCGSVPPEKGIGVSRRQGFLFSFMVNHSERHTDRTTVGPTGESCPGAVVVQCRT